MPAINRSALVMRSAADMYQLINDVVKYPEFLPGCSDAKIISHNSDSMVASLKIAKGGVQKWFTTKNTLVDGQKVIMQLHDGPFKKLQGYWQLTPLSSDACKIELTLDYEFSSKIIELAFGRVFDSVANSMVSAFTQRAKQV
ncbi:type II toxin-antitoxin system RatA family toxin [Thalassotalea ponticola]|uniref:type II toxin-antitoxin system RatA family toxin n=1 Tax=Thalassotalea ponticola TaxID=1523392 RepID=UPI0025B29B68|nr:type II toxin-antitoxin system RatA family toxin [Thalassotalea ponticola]MDN3651686.1 type II toxin-antitoxin system RatA family toxin [Thalassotalea ponticola]